MAQIRIKKSATRQKMDLNKTDKRIFREKLLMLYELEGSIMDRFGKHHTQTQIKAVAKRVYSVRKAIDVILKRIE